MRQRILFFFMDLNGGSERDVYLASDLNSWLECREGIPRVNDETLTYWKFFQETNSDNLFWWSLSLNVAARAEPYQFKFVTKKEGKYSWMPVSTCNCNLIFFVTDAHRGPRFIGYIAHPPEPPYRNYEYYFVENLNANANREIPWSRQISHIHHSYEDNNGVYIDTKGDIGLGSNLFNIHIRNNGQDEGGIYLPEDGDHFHFSAPKVKYWVLPIVNGIQLFESLSIGLLIALSALSDTDSFLQSNTNKLTLIASVIKNFSIVSVSLDILSSIIGILYFLYVYRQEVNHCSREKEIIKKHIPIILKLISLVFVMLNLFEENCSLKKTCNKGRIKASLFIVLPFSLYFLTIKAKNALIINPNFGGLRFFSEFPNNLVRLSYVILLAVQFAETFCTLLIFSLPIFTATKRKARFKIGIFSAISAFIKLFSASG